MKDSNTDLKIKLVIKKIKILKFEFKILDKKLLCNIRFLGISPLIIAFVKIAIKLIKMSSDIPSKIVKTIKTIMVFLSVHLKED